MVRRYKSGRLRVVDDVIEVECRLFGPFRDDAGVHEMRRQTDADTVGDLLRELEAEFPALAGRLVDEEAGTTAGSTVVTKAKKNVKHLDGLDTHLADGDVIRLVPSVYGG
ncbi:MoaD family protein [Halobaculum limi]|uniref:MoaD family protein n=1 Tax=Halobaculum limi TaxID=3031916 RepID=UPI002406716A|nr:MoaD family protein [Halobaculum sp. YSMS11]